MGHAKHDARAFPAPDTNPHQREKLQQAHDKLRAELYAEVQMRQRVAAEALRSLESERTAWEEVHRLRSALLVAIHDECIAAPATDDCWTRATTRRDGWAACNAARRALSPEFLGMVAASRARRRNYKDACRLVLRRHRPQPLDVEVRDRTLLAELWEAMTVAEQEESGRPPESVLP